MATHTDFSTRLCFAAGGSASGLVSNGVAFFLLIFYSQVVGLAPSLTGLALFIALLVDAISDPVVGRWSDQTHSRWGRRHPFLYVAIVPIAACYYALWVPPQLSQMGLFCYLLGVSIALRLALTAFSVPFAALVPELTADYDDRTRLINYNISASWFVGTLMAVAMYAYWLADTPQYPDGSGILRAAGYAEAGLITAVLVIALLALASVGTHRHASQGTPTTRHSGLGDILHQLHDVFREPAFRAMAVSGIFSAAGSGTATALWAYMQPYFWGFDSTQTSWLLTSQLASAMLAFIALPLISRGREKKGVLIYLSWLLIAVSAGPVLLRLAGWFPVNGSQALFLTMLIVGVIQVALIIAVSIVGGSMLSDLVEVREAVSGQREEGSLLAVQSFIGKVATGAGTFLGGAILALIAFPDQTQVAAVDPHTIVQLGLFYGPVLAVLYIISIFALRPYHITRASHAQRQASTDTG